MPVSGRIILPLSKRTILSKISEYDIYRFYLGHDFKLGKSTHSPFHKDNTPSFSISINKKGNLQHIDFSASQKRGNCIDFVMQLFSLEYMEALKKIDSDFGLGIAIKEERDYKSLTKEFKTASDHEDGSFIQVATRRFDTAELAYWNSYYVSERMLRENDVYAIKKLWVNRSIYPIRPGELAFAYLFGDKWKIYMPFANKKFKWLGNVPATQMSGLHRITPDCQVAVVTKAKKDELVLSNFLPHICSVQSESTVSINTNNIRLLQSNCRKTVLNFDSDEAGVQNCKYYNQFGFGWINCPKGYKMPDGRDIKDFADLAKYHGMETVIDYFKLKGIL